jgi:MraZ protein
MFLGQYHHNLDEKGRLTIPAKFREALVEGAYLTQGFDRNLRLLTESDFNLLAEKINHLSMTDPSIRQLRRLIFANASNVQLDRLGRTLIPQFLREFAGLETEAVIVGVGEAIEIWSPDAWATQEDELQDADANVARFAELDLSL